MKNAIIRISLIALFAGFLATPAFAIDQVTTNSGQVYQGTVLNDVTNLYVDIRLVGGETKRIQHSDVKSVDRDVPSNTDMNMMGNQSHAFVSLLLGGFDRLDSAPAGSSNSVLFDYGVKAGVISNDMGSMKLGFALSFDRVSQTVDIYTSSVNDINVQMLFMRVGTTGFYFGPNIGLAINTLSDGTTSTSDSRFEAGAGFGYEFFMTDGFSIGPDVRYEHVFVPSIAYNTLKFDLAFNLHF